MQQRHQLTRITVLLFSHNLLIPGRNLVGRFCAFGVVAVLRFLTRRFLVAATFVRLSSAIHANAFQHTRVSASCAPQKPRVPCQWSAWIASATCGNKGGVSSAAILARNGCATMTSLCTKQCASGLTMIAITVRRAHRRACFMFPLPHPPPPPQACRAVEKERTRAFGARCAFATSTCSTN